MEETNQLVQLGSHLLDVAIHLEDHLAHLLEVYGQLTYWILFFVVFCETGLLITPFLPGDTLLFFTGIFAAEGSLSFPLIVGGFILASSLGDFFNYNIGKFAGLKLVKKGFFFIKPAHVEATQQFYAKYGPRAVAFGRFFPLLRCITPFIAGVVVMPPSRFLLYSLLGSISWVVLLTSAGYYFGHLPVVRDNLSWILLFCLALPFILLFIHFLKRQWMKLRESSGS